MDNNQPNPEFSLPIQTEVLSPIPPEAQEMLKGFLENENTKLRLAFPAESRDENNPDFVNRRDHHFLLLNSHYVLKEVFSKCNLDRSLLIVARDAENIVGFGILGIVSKKDQDAPGPSFVGVSYEYRRQSIGSNIMRTLLQKFFEKGYNQLNVQVWEASKKMIEQMGYTLTPTDQSGKNFKILSRRD